MIRYGVGAFIANLYKGRANDEVMPAVPEAYVLVIATYEIVADDPSRTDNGVLIFYKHV
jgi:hypothetical protein